MYTKGKLKFEMHKKSWVYHLLILINLIFFIVGTKAQAPTVKTFIDRDNILIGEQFSYKVVASFDTNECKINWFTVPDSIPHFELVEKRKIDSSYANNTTTLSQELILTSFDSGQWNIPAFSLSFLSVNKATIKLFTDSILINVGYSPADSTNQLRDIKPIIEAAAEKNYWTIILFSFLALIILLLSIYLARKFRKPKTLSEKISFISAYEQAMQNLEKLKHYNLSDAGQVKQYHFALSEIVKQYFTNRTKVHMLNKTTSDILIHLKTTNGNVEILTNMAIAMRCGDAVKFAKYLPTPTESEDCFIKIKNTIQSIHST